MRTAIFVYQTTTVKISTSESDLQLSCMNGNPVPLSDGDNTMSLSPGTYLIMSSDEIHVSSATSAFDVVATTLKDNDPTPPARATADLAPIDAAALQSFLAIPDAKTVLNP